MTNVKYCSHVSSPHSCSAALVPSCCTGITGRERRTRCPSEPERLILSVTHSQSKATQQNGSVIVYDNFRHENEHLWPKSIFFQHIWSGYFIWDFAASMKYLLDDSLSSKATLLRSARLEVENRTSPPRSTAVITLCNCSYLKDVILNHKKIGVRQCIGA